MATVQDPKTAGPRERHLSPIPGARSTLPGRWANQKGTGAFAPARLIVPRSQMRSACKDVGREGPARSNATLVVAEKAGHLSTLEQPEVVPSAMLAFLGEHPG